MTHYGVTNETERFLLSDNRMYLNGVFVESENRDIIDVIEPSTATTLASIPSATEADVDNAVASARSALRDGPWAVMIGPEGGYARDELDALGKLPFVTRVGLGQRLLRADTAAIAALACWQAVAGSWR